MHNFIRQKTYTLYIKSFLFSETFNTVFHIFVIIEEQEAQPNPSKWGGEKSKLFCNFTAR